MEIPKKIKDYMILDKLGEGTYGQVYRARKDMHVYAIKLVDRKKLDDAGVENLLQEIGILRKLDHPNIVKLFDFWGDKHKVTMVMEYCAGGDLFQYIKSKKKIPETLARYFLYQISSALKYLRERDIAHLDLKPQNLLLVPAKSGLPIVKMADFGFARKLRAHDMAESIRGSPLYMAPEMAIFGIQYDARADLWSIGVILFEVLYGKAPFASESYQELFAKIKAKTAVEIPDEPHVSPECSDLLRRLLVRDPNERISFDDFFSHPFLQTELYMSTARDAAIKAVAADQAGDYFVAYENYCKSLNAFIPAVRDEQDETKKESITRKVKQYVDRAQELKTILFDQYRRSQVATSHVQELRINLVDKAKGHTEIFGRIKFALGIIDKGTALDHKGKFHDAWRTYRQALDTMMAVLNNKFGECPAELKILLHQLVEIYLLRAEELKKLSSIHDTEEETSKWYACTIS